MPVCGEQTNNPGALMQAPMAATSTLASTTNAQPVCGQQPAKPPMQGATAAAPVEPMAPAGPVDRRALLRGYMDGTARPAGPPRMGFSQRLEQARTARMAQPSAVDTYRVKICLLYTSPSPRD
jgi:hypothetical protein